LVIDWSSALCFLTGFEMNGFPPQESRLKLSYCHCKHFAKGKWYLAGLEALEQGFPFFAAG